VLFPKRRGGKGKTNIERISFVYNPHHAYDDISGKVTVDSMKALIQALLTGVARFRRLCPKGWPSENVAVMSGKLAFTIWR
jgi:hypothetical protein